MIVTRKVSVAANPQKKAGAKVRRKAAHPRSKTPMAKQAKKRSASAPRRPAAKKNPNPQPRRRRAAAPRRKNPTHRRRRNPFPGGQTTAIVTDAVTALVALVAARQGPQMLLGANNEGWLGYAANMAATFATAFLAGKVGGPAAYKAALIGGSCYTASRILTEKLSPIGQYLSLTGVGDAAAATSLGGLGTLEDRYNPYPVSYENGQPVFPPELLAAAATQAAGMSASPRQAAALAGMQRYAGY